jgi:hypothetical protein
VVDPAEADDAFLFTVFNDSACDLTVTAYIGLGFISFPTLPVTIPGGTSQYFNVNDAQLDIAEFFSVTTEECGTKESPTPPPV